MIQLEKCGITQHVCHDVKRNIEVVIEHTGIDDRVVASRCSVDFPTQTIEDLGDLSSTEPLGALEQQVLDEVRHTGLARVLKP